MNLTDKRILVTGGNGFLGRQVLAKLYQQGCTGVHAPGREHCDLTSVHEAAQLWATYRPQVVIHLAANVGGIGKNQRSPGRLWLDNMAMAVNVMEMSLAAEVEKVVYVGTVCSYPKLADPPFTEDKLFDGFPEETNAPYGVAKRAIGVGLQAMHTQYGIKAAYLIPTNLYGPGDCFDAQDSHVIPALIRRFVEAEDARQKEVTLCVTGEATREFLFVEDAAVAIVRAAEAVDSPEPINLGGGGEISIKVLAHKIARHCGFSGEIKWDASKPDGQPRRAVDGGRAKQVLGWEPRTDFEDGIGRAVDWFLYLRDKEVDSDLQRI